MVIKWSLRNSRICHRVSKNDFTLGNSRRARLLTDSRDCEDKNWGFKIDDDSEQGTRRCRRISPSTMPPRVSWECRRHGFLSGFERGGREISHGPSFASFQLNFGDVGICSFGAFCGLQGFWVYSHRFLKVKFERVFDVCIRTWSLGYSPEFRISRAPSFEQPSKGLKKKKG